MLSEYPIRENVSQDVRLPNADLRSDREQIRVNRHAYDRIDADGIEIVDLLLAADSACHDQRSSCQLAQARGGIDGETLHQAFAVHMGIEVSAYVGIELRNRFVGGQGDLCLPALYGDAAILGVDPCDEMF